MCKQLNLLFLTSLVRYPPGGHVSPLLKGALFDAHSAPSLWTHGAKHGAFPPAPCPVVIPKRWSCPCTFICSLHIFLLPSVLCQPHHAGNIISPGVKKGPGTMAGRLLWDCSGPLYGDGQGLLAEGPNLLLMPFSPLPAKVSLLSGCRGMGLCVVMFRKSLSSSQPAQRLFCNWLSSFDMIAPFKAHGFDFPANIPGVMQKSSCFFLQQLNPLQGHIHRKEVFWR